MAQKIMSEANYRQRKSALAVALEGAKQEYREAAYQEEIGEAPEGAAAEARKRIEDVEAKQLGLEGAWAESGRLAEAEAARVDRRERRIALSKVDRFLAKRSEAIAAIEKLLTGLGDHVRRFDEAGEEIVSTLRPYMKDFPDLGFGDFARTVRDKTDREAIGGILYGLNVDLTGVSMRDSWFQQRDRSLAEVVAQRNRRIRIAADVLEPEPEETAEEQLERLSETDDSSLLAEA